MHTHANGWLTCATAMAHKSQMRLRSFEASKDEGDDLCGGGMIYCSDSGKFTLKIYRLL
jgi:hypothetical protein